MPPSKKQALAFFDDFKETWEQELPSAVKCMGNSLHSCLTYLQFPKEEWVCLRTTNVIERVNKEFKRRTKPMEIVAGERSCYTLLAFVCLKMEIHLEIKTHRKSAYHPAILQKIGRREFHTKFLTVPENR